MHRSRIQSEVEASPSHSTRNRLLAASLSELLELRKTIKSQAELQALAERYGIDVTKLAELARFINTPSVDQSTIVNTVNQDGEETVTMMVSLFLVSWCRRVTLQNSGQVGGSKTRAMRRPVVF